jgi:RNA polymerase sigma factor (sigma-70 family)
VKPVIVSRLTRAESDHEHGDNFFCGTPAGGNWPREVCGAVGNTSSATADVVQLVHGAADGDDNCWNELVDRYGRLIWSVARGFRVSGTDAAEITQTVWLRLAENIGRIESPERVAAWLVTTTRRECLRELRLQGRQVVLDDEHVEFHLEPNRSAESTVVLEERDAALWRCLDLLPDRSRTLLAMLLFEPRIAYTDIAEALDMPIGSIGPTRARLFATLRRHVEAAGVSAAD